MGDTIVHGGTSLGRGEVDLIQRHTKRLRHQLGQCLQRSPAVVHQGGDDVDRAVNIDLDHGSREIDHVARLRRAGAGGVESTRHADPSSVTAGLRAGSGPVVPADHLGPLAEQFGHPVALNDRAHQRSLPPERVTQPDIVLQPQFQRVDPQLFRHFLDQRLDGKGDLRVAESLHGARGRLVGIDGRATVAHAGELVERDQPSDADAQERVGLDIVRPDIGDQLHLCPGQRAILPGADLEPNPGAIAGVVVHVLFAGQRELDRAASLERQRSADGNGRVHLDARPKGAADRHPLDVDLAQRDTEYLAQQDAHVMNRLRRGPHGEAAVRFGPAHD